MKAWSVYAETVDALTLAAVSKVTEHHCDWIGALTPKLFNYLFFCKNWDWFSDWVLDWFLDWVLDWFLDCDLDWFTDCDLSSVSDLDLDFNFFWFSLGADLAHFNKLIRGFFRLFIHVYITTFMCPMWWKATRFLRFIIILVIVNVIRVDINACLAYLFLLNHLSIKQVGLNLFHRPIGHHRSLALWRFKWLLENFCLVLCRHLNWIFKYVCFWTKFCFSLNFIPLHLNNR